MIRFDKNKTLEDYYHIHESGYDLYAIGDIHGNFNVFKKYVKRYDITKSIFIICGDCGLGFSTVEGDKNELFRLNDLLKTTDCYVICVRGNHDKPSFFNSLEPFEMSNIKCVPDYTVISSYLDEEMQTFPIDGFLCVGGAVSIDRLPRIALYEEKVKKYLRYNPKGNISNVKEMYWKDEIPTFDTNKLDKIFGDGNIISCVISHTAPSFAYVCENNGIRTFLKNDDKLEEDLKMERDVMDSIFQYLNEHQGNVLEKWYFGHFHTTNITEYKGVVFNLLGIEVMTQINTIGQKSRNF